MASHRAPVTSVTVKPSAIASCASTDVRPAPVTVSRLISAVEGPTHGGGAASTVDVRFGQSVQIAASAARNISPNSSDGYVRFTCTTFMTLLMNTKNRLRIAMSCMHLSSQAECPQSTDFDAYK